MSMSRSRAGYTSPTIGRDGDREGFERLMHTNTNTRSGDATINIPLEDRNDFSGTPSKPPMNEKDVGGYFSRRGVRKSMIAAKKQTNAGYDGEEDKVTKMGHIYDKILNFSVFTRYFLYIIPVAAIIAIPIIVGATAKKDDTLGNVRMVWVFVWLLCSWVGLWGSKVVAHYLPKVFQALTGVVSAGTRKYSLILKQLEIPLSLCGWALVTLATFKPLMTRNPAARAQDARCARQRTRDPAAYDRNPDCKTADWIDVVQQILAAAMISALVFAGERLFVQIISINYHRKQFHNKIKDSKRQLYILGLLYEASRGMFPTHCMEFEEEDAIIDEIIDLPFKKRNKKKGAHSRSGSSTPMKMLQEVGNLGDKVTAAFGTIAQEVTGKQNSFNPNSAHSIVTRALEKNRSSEALARRLWLSFVIEGHDALYPDDLNEVLGSHRQAEADEAFSMLDKDTNGDVSLDEMVLTVSQIGRERHSIANSMHDVDQAIKVLDRMLCTVIFIIVIFIFVAFLNASFVTTLATAGTALLSLSFVFSATAAEFLGSCIFLFVKHPFDVGDRVDLNTGTDQMIVEHISLLFSVFRRVDNHRAVQIPNMVLNTLWIENVSRSSAMKEELSIFVAFDTSLEDLQLLRNEMRKFVTASENRRDFQDEINIEVVNIHEMNKLQLSIDIQHKSNWSNETIRAARRSKFMCALVLALRKVPIYGPGGGAPGLGSAGNPSYSVSVDDKFAVAAREKAEQDMEGKRLVPTKKPSSPSVEKLADSLGAPSELRVMSSLNDRDPALDGARDAGGYRSGSGISPTSPRLTGNDVDPTAQQGLMRRATTQGRRKSKKHGDPYSYGANVPPSYPPYSVHSQASSTAIDTASSRTGAPQVPQIGVTGPLQYQSQYQQQASGRTAEYPARSSSQSDEDWYGNEQRESEQLSTGGFPQPPSVAGHAYRPSNPGAGTWRGT